MITKMRMTILSVLKQVTALQIHVWNVIVVENAKQRAPETKSVLQVNAKSRRNAQKVMIVRVGAVRKVNVQIQNAVRITIKKAVAAQARGDVTKRVNLLIAQIQVYVE